MRAVLFSDTGPSTRTEETGLALVLLVSSLDLLTYLTMMLEDQVISARHSAEQRYQVGLSIITMLHVAPQSSTDIPGKSQAPTGQARRACLHRAGLMVTQQINQKNLLVRHTVTSRETCILDAMYSRAFSEVKPYSVKVLKIH